jgi:phosphoenolpyruvate carboxykinase (GTP)
MRVLRWMLERIEGEAGGVEHVTGTSPRYEDLDWRGSDFTAQQFAQVISTDAAAWREELALHDEWFDKLRQRLPAALGEVKSRLEARIAG